MPEFHVVYVEVGRRSIVERIMYDESPFIVIPEPGKRQSTGVQVFVNILSENKCRIEINGSYKIEKELEFGELFQAGGFAFRIRSRVPG